MADRDSNRIKKRVKTDVGSDVRCEQWNSLHLFSQSWHYLIFFVYENVNVHSAIAEVLRYIWCIFLPKRL